MYIFPYTVISTHIFVPLHHYSCPNIKPKIIKASSVKRTTRLFMMMMNCFCGIVDRHLALFPAGTIARDCHLHESLTRH